MPTTFSMLPNEVVQLILKDVVRSHAATLSSHRDGGNLFIALLLVCQRFKSTIYLYGRELMMTSMAAALNARIDMFMR